MTIIMVMITITTIILILIKMIITVIMMIMIMIMIMIISARSLRAEALADGTTCSRWPPCLSLAPSLSILMYVLPNCYDGFYCDLRVL